MSGLQDLAIRLIGVGMLGVGWMLAYLQACRWVDWDNFPAYERARVRGWQRRAPVLIVLSGAVAGLGLLLLTADLAAR
ncbi:MAG: hypothetical protein ACXV4A_10420 [Actinomycetes bacterium]